MHQPFSNHNGGALAFGPDGMLYVGMGDGGSEGDPEGNGQNQASLLGKILRLDVAQPNPRPADRTHTACATRGGSRSTRPTGDLWIGDVGQNRYEEVDHLPAGTRPGANLGWNAYEGRAVYKRQPIDRSRLVWPVAVYPHTEGCSITGGYVYRGSEVPALRGRYVYGDFCSGRIWSLPTGGGRPQLLALPRLEGLSSFGLDAARRAVRDHAGRPRPALRRDRLVYRRAPADHAQRATPAGIAGGTVGRRSLPATATRAGRRRAARARLGRPRRLRIAD